MSTDQASNTGWISDIKIPRTRSYSNWTWSGEVLIIIWIWLLYLSPVSTPTQAIFCTSSFQNQLPALPMVEHKYGTVVIAEGDSMKRQTLSYVLLFKKWAMGGIVLSPPMVECVSSHISKTNWANSMIDDCFLAQYKSERVREKVMPITHLIQPQISGCSKRDHSKLVHQEMSELMVKSRNKAGENLKTQIYSFPCPQLLFPASEFIIL